MCQFKLSLFTFEIMTPVPLIIIILSCTRTGPYCQNRVKGIELKKGSSQNLNSCNPILTSSNSISKLIFYPKISPRNFLPNFSRFSGFSRFRGFWGDSAKFFRPKFYFSCQILINWLIWFDVFTVKGVRNG